MNPTVGEAPDLLNATLSRVRRRVLVSRLLAIASLDLLLALSLLAAYVLAVRLFGLPWRPVPALILALCGSVLLTAVRAAFGLRLSLFAAAVMTDERLRLRERVSSAVYLTKSTVGAPAAAWGEVIRRDGERSLAGADIPRNFPVRPPRLLRWTLLPAVLAIGFAFLPPVDLLGLNEKREVDAAMRGEVARKRDDLQKKIDDLRKTLEKPVDPQVEQAIEAFKKQEAKNAEAKKADEQPAGEEAKKNAMMEFGRLEEAIKNGLDKPEMQKLREFLDRFPAGSKTSSALTKALREALKEGDFQKAGKELKDLTDKLGDLKGKKGSELTKEEEEKLKKLSEELAKLGRDSAMLSKLSRAFSGAASGMASGGLPGSMPGLEDLAKQLEDLANLDKDLEFLQSALDLAKLSLEELGDVHKCPNCGKVSKNPGGT